MYTHIGDDDMTSMDINGYYRCTQILCVYMRQPLRPPLPPPNGHGTPLPLWWGYVVWKGEKDVVSDDKI